MSDTRRRFGRFDCDLEVHLHIDAEVLPVRASNIGLGGIFVETDRDLPFGQAVEIKVELLSPRQTIEANATVMWRQGTAGLGFSFDALRPIDVWALLQFFNTLQVA